MEGRAAQRAWRMCSVEPHPLEFKTPLQGRYRVPEPEFKTPLPEIKTPLPEFQNTLAGPLPGT